MFQVSIQIFITLSIFFFILERKSSKSKCECGQAKRGRDPQSFSRSGMFQSKVTRIVDGYDPSKVGPLTLEPRHLPWMTYIKISIKNLRFSCGGSIINNYWILSAGHCFCEQLKCKPSKRGSLKIDFTPQDHIRIITGLKDRINKTYLRGGQVSKPDRIIIHPL